MNILFVAAEVSPLVKVGGLADVVGSLPKALNKLGHDVRIMLPQYGVIDGAKYKLSLVSDSFNAKVSQTVKPFTLSMADVDSELKVYLIGNEEFLEAKDVYGGNELRRFLLFDRAVAEGLPELDWQPNIVHCHDWHTGLIPMWLKKNNWDGALIFTIHNLAYQGSFGHHFMAASGLSRDWQNKPDDVPELPLNFMSQGIVWADMVTTVSENYAREIVTPEYGAGLNHLLCSRRDKLLGIINGIDYEEYNPSTDRFIAATYDSGRLDSKLTNKLALQRKVGLFEDSNAPLIGMVSRLDDQKGLDIVIDAFALLFERTHAQMIILGRGRECYHHLLQRAARKYPHRLAVSYEFDDALAHLIYAGCDMFLMPSRFEPCGLGQLIAMRYGTVPVVRHTGGLVDTVENLSADLSNGRGFVFKQYDVNAMLKAIKRAIEAYQNKLAWQKITQRIMSLDFSWQNSARKYEAVYKRVLELQDYAKR